MLVRLDIAAQVLEAIAHLLRGPRHLLVHIYALEIVRNITQRVLRKVRHKLLATVHVLCEKVAVRLAVPRRLDGATVKHGRADRRIRHQTRQDRSAARHRGARGRRVGRARLRRHTLRQHRRSRHPRAAPFAPRPTGPVRPPVITSSNRLPNDDAARLGGAPRSAGVALGDRRHV